MTARALFSRLHDLLVHVGVRPVPQRRASDRQNPHVAGVTDQEIIYRLLLESGTAETFRHA